VLYATLLQTPTSVPKRFGSHELIAKQQFPTDALPVREGRFFLLKGYESDHAD
jgi:hypothetical protein